MEKGASWTLMQKRCSQYPSKNGLLKHILCGKAMGCLCEIKIWSFFYIISQYHILYHMSYWTIWNCNIYYILCIIYKNVMRFLLYTESTVKIHRNKEYKINIIYVRWVNLMFTLFAPGRCSSIIWNCNFQNQFTDLYLVHFPWNCSHMNATDPFWWQISIDSGHGLVPSCSKPLPELM